MTYRRSHRWILGILILVLVGAIFFAPSYGWELRSWLGENLGSGNGAGQGTSLDASTSALAAQNAELEAELAMYQTVASQLPVDSSNDIRAMVYSRYPLNFKNEILVNAGSADGVTSGTAALFEGLLIGRVIQVFPHESLIQTVFDSGFEMAVRVSTSSYDGLFEGGAYPSVGSITKSANLSVGDVVYSATPGLPYGIPIGTVAATSTSADSLFTQAAVTFPYDIDQIKTVFIAQGS